MEAPGKASEGAGSAGTGGRPREQARLITLSTICPLIHWMPKHPPTHRNTEDVFDLVVPWASLDRAPFDAIGPLR